MPSSRADFFVDMSGQIPSRRSTKLSGNKCSDVPTKIQTSSYAMNHWDWPGKQWRAEHQACCCTCLTARYSQTIEPFWRLTLSIYIFFSLFWCSFANGNSFNVDKALVDDSTKANEHPMLFITAIEPSASTKIGMIYLEIFSCCFHKVFQGNLQYSGIKGVSYQIKGIVQ